MGKRNRQRSVTKPHSPTVTAVKKSKHDPPPHVTLTEVYDLDGTKPTQRDVCMVHRLKIDEWSPSGVRVIEVGMNGSLLFLVRDSGRIEVWETNRYTCIKKMDGKQVTGVFCVDDVALQRPRLFTASMDSSLLEWSLDGHETKWSEEVSGGGIWSGALYTTDNGCQLGLACDDGTLRIYSLTHGESFRLHGLLQCDSTRALCLSWASDGRHMAVGYGDGTARLWELQAQPSTHLCSGHETLKLSFSKSGEKLVSVWSVLCLAEAVVCGDSDGRVRFWDRRFGSELCAFKKHEAEVTVLKEYVHSGVHYVLATGADPAVVIFRKDAQETWQYLHVRRPHLHDIQCVAIFESGPKRHQTIMTGSADTLVQTLTCAADMNLIETFAKKRLRTLDTLPEAPLVNFAAAHGTRIAMVVHRLFIDFWKIPDDPKETAEHRVDGDLIPAAAAVPFLVSRMKVSGSLPIIVAALSPSLRFFALSTAESFKLISVTGLTSDDGAATFKPIKIQKPNGPASQALFSSDSQHLFIIDAVDSLTSFDTASWCVTRRIKLAIPLPSRFAFRFQPTLLTLSASASFLAFAIFDTICVYSIHSKGVHEHVQFQESAPVVQLCFDATEKLVCLLCTRKVRRYDMELKTLDHWSVSNPVIHPFRNIPFSPAHSISPRSSCPSVLMGFGSGSMHLTFHKGLSPMTHPSANLRGCNPRVLSLDPHHRTLFDGFMDEQSILSIYADWNDVLQKRPAPVYRHRYGT